ncbi:MAG: hypothetical protein MI919_21450, partial [Holophagales bacterium]|nr:hypothetical protein [Holophagales bacterium]
MRRNPTPHAEPAMSAGDDSGIPGGDAFLAFLAGSRPEIDAELDRLVPSEAQPPSESTRRFATPSSRAASAFGRPSPCSPA